MKIVLAVIATLLVTILVLNLTTSEKKVQRKIESLYAVTDDQFARTMGSLLGPPLVAGNSVVDLQNGDAIFPAMLEAIASAQRSICFETYIYWSGATGQKFADALGERASAGIPVHLLVDYVGSGRMDEAMLSGLRARGVEIHKYHPPRFYNLSRMNNRTHRKLLIVDGRVGFTGGVGIADKWNGNARTKEEWRDSHYRVEGPVVAQMQSAFLDNWIEGTGRVLHGDAYFPEQAVSSEAVRAQMFKSAPGEGSESVRLMYLLSISAARKSIRIAASYFVPDDLAVEMLVAARKRGVRVEVIVPGKEIDTELVRKASRSRWGDLLEAGVEILEFQPTMYHCKVMIVDDLWVSVGSTNFDNRSFRLNDEANLNVLDQAFALKQSAIFEEDRSRARLITFAEWKNRPRGERFAEWTAGLLRHQL